MNKEEKYFKKLISSVHFEDNILRVNIGDDKNIIGVIGKANEEYIKKFAIKTLHDTVIDLDRKVKYSLYQAMKYMFLDNVYNSDSMLINSKEEEKAYYYIENAIFRIETLWDILAQIYNIQYKIGKDKLRIYYKSFFKEMSDKSEDEELKNRSSIIFDYLDEVEDTNLDGFWKGNNKYLKDIRNCNTHRNSSSLTTFSDFDIKIKEPIIFMTKRVIEDYYKVYEFLKEILKNCY